MASIIVEKGSRRIIPPGTNLSEILYEVVGDDYVEKPAMGAVETFLASLLQTVLGAYVRTNGLGRVFSETLFSFRPAVDRDYRPDLAFVSAGRWPLERRIPRRVNALPVAPDLVIEVVSPSNEAGEVIAKLDAYFRGGVRRAWVIYPDSAKVYDYASPTEVEVKGPGDALDGGELLPGFRLAVDEFFSGIERDGDCGRDREDPVDESGG